MRSIREARRARPEERERLWTLITSVYPSYDRYRGRTSRAIDVVVLKPQRRA